MKFRLHPVTVLASFMTVLPSAAEITYSNLRDIAIPADFAGIYLNVETGLWNADINNPQAGWDINPFFGGSVLWNSPDFQPVRSGTNATDAVVKLAEGTSVSSGSTYSTFVQGPGGQNPGGPGFGFSDTHLGNGGNQFAAGQEGYFGFRLNGADYGWMRVVFTDNAGGALIKEWAYESGGAAISVGNIKRTGSDVVLDSTNGNFTVGSVISNSGGTTNVLKSGTGTTTLSNANTYTGTTTVSAGTLTLSNNNAVGTGAITLSGPTSVLSISSGVTLANATNDITVSNTGASVVRTVAASTGLNTTDDYTVGTLGSLKSNFTGGQPDTTASILEGTNSAGSAATLTMGFNDTSIAGNDALRRSDVFSITGTGSDAYVLQLTVSGMAAGSRMGWLDTVNNQWIDAGTTFFNAAYDNVLTVGNYGFDSATGSVWAVVNYGGSFAAVPEPTSALAGLLIGAGLLRRRRTSEGRGSNDSVLP